MSLLPKASLICHERISFQLDQARQRSSTNLRIKVVVEILQDSFNHNPSLESLSRSVNLSQSRLRCLFREVTGLPLALYVKLLRLETARHLLKTDFLTIKEVMAKTGIRDHSHFNRDFKATYGLTPSQYRDQSKHPEDQS